MKIKCYIKRVDGRIDRLAGDENDARDIPQGFSKSSSIPGGWGSCSFTLSRDAMRRDLDPYDELIVHGDGNQVLFEGYGIEFPASEDDKIQVTTTGWATSLKDLPCPNLVVIDREFASWVEPPLIRKASLGSGFTWNDYSVSSDDGMEFLGSSGADIPANSIAEAFYAAPSGVLIGQVDYQGSAANTSNTSAPLLGAGSDESLASDFTFAPQTMDNTLRSAMISPRRYLTMNVVATSDHTPSAGSAFNRRMTTIAVRGDHGISKVAVSGEPDCAYAHDILAYVLRRCPHLNVFVGPGGIETTTFPIPHFKLVDVESLEEAALQINRFDIQDWGVYENRTVFSRPPGTGRTFVARTDDHGVSYSDAGITGDDLYTGVIATFTDPTGKSYRVGPLGSDCDVESAAMSNPASNALSKRGRSRIGQISISETAVLRDVLQTAGRWLTEKNLVETRGDAEVSGSIRDIAGAKVPVAEIKAGDQIIFPDREWKARRIVEETYTGDSDSTAMSLDAPPSKIDSMMERMGVYNEAANV